MVGDAARKDGDGYFWIIGRTDDVINVSGHRLSTAEVESAIVAHAKVAEAAVVAEADEMSGQAIVAFVTLNAGARGNDQVAAEIRAYVGERIGKLARPKSIIWAEDLPKTRSGKIMRRLLRDIAEGRELGDVSTWEILRLCGLQAKAAAAEPRARADTRTMDESVLLLWNEELLTYDLGPPTRWPLGGSSSPWRSPRLGLLARRDLRVVAPAPRPATCSS